MASNIRAQVAGGQERTLNNVHTVADVKREMGAEGFQATVNGEPEGDDYQLENYQFVSLTKAVKAG